MAYTITDPRALGERSPYMYDSCGKRYMNKSLYKAHVLSHAKVGICYYCRNKLSHIHNVCIYWYSGALALLLKQDSCMISDKQFRCLQCNKQYTQHKDPKAYIATNYTAETYICETCGNTYRKSLDERMKAKHEMVKHVCGVCGGSFPTSPLWLCIRRSIDARLMSIE